MVAKRTFPYETPTDSFVGLVTEWLRNGYGNPSGREGVRGSEEGARGARGGLEEGARGRKEGARRASGRLERKGEIANSGPKRAMALEE